MADSMDQWLDHALAEYSDVSAPFGFESRTVARLREERPLRRWGWITAVAFAAALALAVFTRPGLRVEEMKVPPIAVKIRVPAIEKTRMVGERRAMVARVKVDPMRGVPIVATPLTAQEQALLRVVRNARAKQYAALVSQPQDLSKEVAPLEFKRMEIPLLGREEK